MVSLIFFGGLMKKGSVKIWLKENWKQTVSRIVCVAIFIAFIYFLRDISVAIDHYQHQKYSEAYDAGYKLGYHVAFLEYDIILVDEEMSLFSAKDIDESIKFIRSKFPRKEQDYFEKGFDDGLTDGRNANDKLTILTE
jgi:hypothetical protein